ncbi:MAG: RagB/SusD family nutrient uptake outer membrane protein [Gemmatimonadota bacterium]|nr:RagB/SusD family nutrient uptake outer membrane protein [Gemmatimonadota bacterium]HEU4988227.1 RagB/SusD family nutrient uptake outer membrane protein [Gemmatimonadaceae bacterium]
MMRHSRFLPAVALLAVVAGCDMSVTNPGPLQDSQLNTPSAMPALVNGMSGDLSLALGDFLIGNTVMTDELTHSGNYAAPNEFAVGVIRPEDVDPDYQRLQQARWVAEDGLRRMQQVLGAAFESNTDTPRAYLYAGFANRLLGENSCQAVIDGGGAQSDSVYFQRAESLFTRANALATAQHNTAVATAALGGRASVRADLGNWAGAVADAAQVPASFHYDAIFSLNTSRENNDLAYETHTRRELSVYATQWAANDADPRTPWDTVFTSAHKVQTGQDGHTPFFRQDKFSGLDSDIPLTKGAEMLLIQAENALRNGDIGGMTGFINLERAVYGMAAVSAPGTTADAWTLLQKERGAVLWLEARRLWDLRRWLAAGTNSFLATRDKCMPFGSSELASNPNLH